MLLDQRHDDRAPYQGSRLCPRRELWPPDAAATPPASIHSVPWRQWPTTVLPPLVRRFRSLHPGIELVALETDDREVETSLDTGAVDLGVVLNPCQIVTRCSSGGTHGSACCLRPIASADATHYPLPNS
ncbi:hypothetical protein AGR6A_pAt30018 [Agrobacterium sp. NCPPB 925]|nr:hypothetical protein AGR6A_pAt30018 [Agrobacterium sp. NCPPB 925]